MEGGSMPATERSSSNNSFRTGVICVFACQMIWGFLPIYWQALKPIETWVIILYRIVTMFVYSYIAARCRYSREEIWGPLRDRSVRRKYFTSGFVLLINWSIYIWAMNSGRVIQASIGYYIEPIMICLVGIIVFKEALTKYNLTAMLFALAAIILILVHFRQLPGTALGIATSWAIYSAIKKTAKQPVLISLVYETFPFAIIAVFAIIYIESRGIGALSVGMPGKYALMYLCGLVTLVPVALFNVSARNVPLYMLGLFQYVSPTISLILGIFLFREPIDIVQIIAFIIVWTGLIFFTYGEFAKGRTGSIEAINEKTTESY